MDTPMKTTGHGAALHIVSIYALVGGLWIYLSDSALGWLIRDPVVITRIAVFKGLLFIVLTASLLYFLISRFVSRMAELNRHQMESEENLKSVMELMPMGVSWADGNGKMEYVNPDFSERFGYTLADIPTVEEWFLRAYPDPAYREQVATAWNRDSAEAHLGTRLLPPREAHVVCKDGTVRHVIINTQLVRNRTIAIFTDITERENLQNEFIKTQKLESLGMLAGGIAHDFNNILTAIVGNVSFAQMFLDTAHKSALPLREAEKAAQRAAELAHQLLTFAKGGQPITKAASVKQLIDESVSLSLRGSRVKGVVELQDNLMPIKVDEGQISQAFNNIIINAVQAMPGGGTITIRAENAVLEETNRFALSPGEYVRILFSDQGNGIPFEDQKKIFDPYFTTKPTGTGLGLASVHSIVGKHGGHIAVYSVVNNGATFEIYLPATRDIPGEPDTTPASVPSGHPSGTPILVMDDEEMIRNLTAEMLGNLGYRVMTCVDGERAVSLYRSARDAGTPFAAVIMDLTIPGGMGGREAAQQILTIDPGARLIVSSGYSNDPIMAEPEAHGFCCTVVKPYRAAELARVVSCALAGTAPPPP